ncbi:MAG TPA: hypothetical protein DCR14_08805 [Acidimicrobiaceae bacterium]|nr:hypothetical protein [Acidimicrobiaceae bacterium]
MNAAVIEHIERVSLLLGFGLLLGAAEWANPFPANPRRDRAETRRHLWWLGASLIVGPTIGWVVNRSVADMNASTPLRQLVGQAPLVVRVAIALFVGELVAYWLHRAMHASRLLWRLHAIHHQATEVRWWTAFRAHPLSGLLVHVLPFSAAAATGAGRDAVAAYVGVVVVVTVLAHADVYLPVRGLDRVLVTPAFHRVHHHADGGRRHYSQVLSLFDDLFCTRSPQPTSRKPIDNDAVLATADATHAAAGSPSRHHSTAASNTSTSASARASAPVRPAAPRTMGTNSSIATG